MPSYGQDFTRWNNCFAIHVGSGQVKCAHESFLSAPACSSYLKICHLRRKNKGTLHPQGTPKHSQRFGEMPIMKTTAIGYGMGKKIFETANCVRIMLGARTAQILYLSFPVMWTIWLQKKSDLLWTDFLKVEPGTYLLFQFPWKKVVREHLYRYCAQKIIRIISYPCYSGIQQHWAFVKPKCTAMFLSGRHKPFQHLMASSGAKILMDMALSAPSMNMMTFPGLLEQYKPSKPETDWRL